MANQPMVSITAPAMNMQTGEIMHAAGSALSGVAGAVGSVLDSAPSAGGGFVFEADKLDGLIKKWHDLLDDLMADRKDGMQMSAIVGPGREFASGDFVDSANPSGRAFMLQNQRMIKYVEGYLEALTTAKKRITGNNEQTAADLQRTGDAES